MLRNEHFSELENIYLCTLVDEIALPVSGYIPFIFFLFATTQENTMFTIQLRIHTCKGWQ